jgi:HAE1 family hydrophobic/amphiphilic exporter-1
MQAARTGIDEVGVPVIAADLTTVAAFLPMLLVPGIMGDFMGVMPKVVSVALIGSMAVDHLLIPVLAAHWYRQKQPAGMPADEPAADALTAEAPITAVGHVSPVGQVSNLSEEDQIPPSAAAPNGAPILISDQPPNASPPNSHLRPKLGLCSRAYAASLRWALANRWVVLTCCGMSLVWAGVMLRSIGFDFFPVSDRGQFEINYELPLGYSIHQTLKTAEVLTRPLLELPKDELAHFVTAVGSSAGLATRLETDPTSGPEFGKIMVQLTPPTERKRHQREIIREIRSKIRPYPGLKYRIDEAQEGPPGGSDVAVRLSGKDLEQLGNLAEAIARRLEREPGTDDVGTDYRPHSPELIVEPRPEVAGLFQISDAEVAQAVQTAILGDSTIQLSMGDEDVTLRLQADPAYQKCKQNVTRLMVTGPTGRQASIGQLADVRRASGLYAINRWDRRRAVTVRCDVIAEEEVTADKIFGLLREEILPELGFRAVETEGTTLFGQIKSYLVDRGFEMLRQPAKTFLGNPVTEAEGIRAVFTGENEERDENFEYMFSVMVVGVVLIFAVLVIQFNSFRQTLIVLMSVPLSFVGVVFGMWICQDPFSLASFIGLIALAGVVVNDAIVLVDFTNQARRRGLPVQEAILEAGVNRLRPVILTTVTTIGGLLPLFLNWSGGAEFWRPLTGAVIFGLSFATLLTLLVIPVCYSLAYARADRPKK